MSATTHRVALMLDLQWPFKRHAEVYVGIQHFAEANGWVTVLDEFAHDTLRQGPLAAERYDGIVARANVPLARHAAARGVPVVNVWPSSPVSPQLPGVFPDSTAVGRLLAEHLLARGFRTFATLTASTNADNRLEVQEFARLVQEAGFQCHSTDIPQHSYGDVASWRKLERLVTRAMDEWVLPVGVYVAQEDTGRLLVQMCHRRGWRVPGDVAIIAGKNQEILCEQPRPSLTSVEIGYERIGYAAAELLAQLMTGSPPPTEPLRLPPLGLVVRESTDFFAVNDPFVAAALAFIAANSHRPIGPNDVARAVGVETRSLQNYFQKTLQRPIGAEIRRVRIERVKRELIQGKRSLTAIAHDAGFGSIQRLYEVFHREVGISPSEYRQQRQIRKE
ncbi:MAG: AraC family transcriptional regulator [Gemmataceae bacterium]